MNFILKSTFSRVSFSRVFFSIISEAVEEATEYITEASEFRVQSSDQSIIHMIHDKRH